MVLVPLLCVSKSSYPKYIDKSKLTVSSDVSMIIFEIMFYIQINFSLSIFVKLCVFNRTLSTYTLIIQPWWLGGRAVD